MRENYKKLGPYIRQVNNRNKNLVTQDLRGLSMTKEFRKSTSNIVGTDLTKYKLVNKNQFACDFMSVIRVHKLPVVLHSEIEPVIVSPAYTVFEVIDKDILNPEYLMMWFRRAEFDRYADFRCDSAIRGGFKWDELCETELPIPSIEKQRAFVAEYNTVQNRIQLNEQLIQKLEETAQTIYRRWFVEFEFPIDKELAIEMGDASLEGKPYRASGGKMVWSEELEKDVPVGWEINHLSDFVHLTKERIDIDQISINNYISTENMLQDMKGVTTASSLPPAKTTTMFNQGDILISNIRPYFKKIWFAQYKGGCSNDILCLVLKDEEHSNYIFHSLANDVFFDYVMQGAKGTKMPRGDKDWIMNYLIVLPYSGLLKDFESISTNLRKQMNFYKSENITFKDLSEIILSRMTKVEETVEKTRL